MGLGNGNPKSGNKGSNHNHEHRQLILLGELIAAVNASGGGGAPTTRTGSLLVVLGALAIGNTAPGARSVTFFNAGTTRAVVAGGDLDAGESVTFDAGGQSDTLNAIQYTTLALGKLKISTVI